MPATKPVQITLKSATEKRLHVRIQQQQHKTEHLVYITNLERFVDNIPIQQYF